MRKLCFLLFVLFPVFFFLTGVKASPGAISVIVSSDSQVNSISRSDLKRIYKGEMLNWKSGGKITVVDFRSDSPLRAEFYRKALNASPTQKFYPGGPLPFRAIEQRSPDAMKRFVATLPTAIGYISASELDSTVKEILKVE